MGLLPMWPWVHRRRKRKLHKARKLFSLEVFFWRGVQRRSRVWAGELNKKLWKDEVRWVSLKVSQQVELLPVGFLVLEVDQDYYIPVVRNFNDVKWRNFTSTTCRIWKFRKTWSNIWGKPRISFKYIPGSSRYVKDQQKTHPQTLFNPSPKQQKWTGSGKVK